MSMGRGGVPAPAGLVWQEEIAPAGSFSHRWPTRAGAESNDERYEPAWAGTIALQGVQTSVKIDESKREIGGTNNRRGKLTVFFDDYPTAEFVDTADGSGWASPIKPNSRTVLPVGVPVPPLYRNARVVPYRTATGLAGIGIPKGLSVVIHRADLRSAAHHAAARWLARRNFPLTPAA